MPAQPPGTAARSGQLSILAFVLISTSVGQEGLDFRPYSHAVVHWNLPSNPIDLEQREGRVHRYKNHAIRRNVARQFAAAAVQEDGDPWTQAFELATRAGDPEDGDLVPFWVYPLDGGARIERHVLLLR
jgi:superfamily II DNA/RNA helicase